MHRIKKYANRKLYNITQKKYISMDQLAELIKSGEEVSIIDNKTGKDLTASIVSQLIAREKMEKENELPSRILIQLLRKGSGTFIDYAKKYTSLWQGALTMAEDEIDKLIHLLIKDKELSETEGHKLKKEVVGYTDNLKNWIGQKIDHRINEVMGMMNLPTKDQVQNLTKTIASLERKVKKLEKSHTQKKTKSKP
jgi:polyhydroxyalkanoate synthesis repressor PhaR